MIELKVPNISCGHCVSTVTQAIKQVDPNAKVEVDLASKSVKVESPRDCARFVEALSEAGYPPAS